MKPILISIISGVSLLILISIIFDFLFYPRVFLKVEEGTKNNSFTFILRNAGNRDIYNFALGARVDKNLAVLRVSHTSLHNVALAVHKCSEDLNGFYSSGVRLETNNLPPFANATVIIEVGKVDADKVGDVFPASYIDLPPKSYCLEYSYRGSGILTPFHIKKRVYRYFNGEKLDIKKDYDKDNYSQKFLKDGKENTITFDAVEKSTKRKQFKEVGVMQLFIIWLIVSLFFTGLTIVSGYRTKEEWDKWRKSKIESANSRPLIYISPNKIEYSSWTDREKLDDPGVTSKCEKIILYFGIHNNSKSPAKDVDIKVTSSILQEKYVDKFTPSDIKNSYGHNIHLITENNPGRQPFILGLDKKWVRYFNDGTIKVKLIINVKYRGLNDNKEYWSESAFIYSPTFEKQKEIYSKSS